MQYNINLIKQENYRPTFWSGGMATELITYPPTSNYANRNFLWRLGIAKIDISESTFSELPGVSRKFMITEGKLTIDHETKYKKLLAPFDQDSFLGDWKTKTYGKASVFNLMTRENYDGELIHFNILPKKQYNFKYKAASNRDLISLCFYVVSGGFKIIIDNKTITAQKNDLLLVDCINSNYFHEFLFSSESLEITNIITSIIYRE